MKIINTFAVIKESLFSVQFETNLFMNLQNVLNYGPFLIIEVSCTFDVAEGFWKKFQKKNTVTISKNFMIHLAMLTVGTTRGVLHEKTNKTAFNDFILPTINITEMITKDAILEY